MGEDDSYVKPTLGAVSVGKMAAAPFEFPLSPEHHGRELKFLTLDDN